MDIKKINQSIAAIVLVIATPVIFFIIGRIQDSNREPLACEGEPGCTDLRGLDALPYMFGLWIFAGIVGILLSVNGLKRNEPQAKIALWITSILTVLPVVLILVALITND